MQRRFLPVLWACTLLLFSMQAAAQAQPASYVVAPFQVNGPAGFSYLEKAIPPMLTSRLFWQGKFKSPWPERTRPCGDGSERQGRGGQTARNA